MIAAPMSGGPTTPALVLAAAEAGSAGFLAGGYKSAEALAEQVAEVRASTEQYGVNLFSPNQVPVDPAAYAAYRELLLPLAATYGVDLPATPVEDDDGWHDKVEVLVAAAPPVVSFTFGLPDAPSVRALARAGCTLVQTVTSADEARQAAEAGLDALVVQSADAGGHSGTFTPERLPVRLALPDLVREVRAAVDLPVVAAGGVGTRDDVTAALEAGADAVAVRHRPPARVGSRHQRRPPGGLHPGPRRAGHHRRVLRTPRRRAAQRLPGGVRRPRTARLPRRAPPDQPHPPGRRRAGQPGARRTSGPAPGTGASASGRPATSCASWRRRAGELALTSAGGR